MFVVARLIFGSRFQPQLYSFRRLCVQHHRVFKDAVGIIGSVYNVAFYLSCHA